MIDKLIKLKTDNPELEIITMTNYDVCCGDDFRYWRGEISSVEIDIYYEDFSFNDGVGMVIGEEAIKDLIFDELEDENVMNQEYNKLEKEGKIIKAIFIFIDT